MKKVIGIALVAAAFASAVPADAQTVSRSVTRRPDCTYVRSTNSVGDIIFGRSATTVCDDHNRRVDNAWYQVGRDRSGSVIYERRFRDANGKLVIQRARRTATGAFVVVATRPYGQNKADYKAWKASEKAEDKTEKTNMKASDKAQKEAWKDTKVVKKGK